MVEKNVNKCVRHDLRIEKFTQSNKDGSTEQVSACDICAKILKVAGYDLKKVPAVARQEEERGAFGLPKKVLDAAAKEFEKHKTEKPPYWDN